MAQTGIAVHSKAHHVKLSELPIVDLTGKHQPLAKVERAKPRGDSSETGIDVTSHGQGQVSGVTYTVPAHGELKISISLHQMCVTPEDVKTLNDLIRSLLDASHHHSYDELEKTEASGGISFISFFSAGASASYSDTKHTMDSWGLSEDNQKTIVDNMMALVMKTNDFGMEGMVYNKEYDYSVSGNIFGVVMDATIKTETSDHQIRVIAPKTHMNTSDGSTLPITGNLY